MSDKVKLKKVTADNWEAVVELELRGSQEDLVASNLYSVAEAQFDPDARPRAIYAGKRVVGFLMYDVQKTKGKAQEASIYRFMVDRRHQGKGYGRAALSKALEEIRAIPGVNRISIRYMPKNPVAKPFYASFGFVEVGRDRDGEVIAVLKL
jgi:diamine N-acetyltransferase